MIFSIPSASSKIQVQVLLLQNCTFIQQLVHAQKPTCVAACINPRMIPSLFVLQTTLHHVVLAKNEPKEVETVDQLNSENITSSSANNNAQTSSGGWKTQNIHTELLYKLNPKRNIGQAFKNFGANDHSSEKAVLCVACKENENPNLENYIFSNFTTNGDSNLKIISDQKEIDEYLKRHVDTQTICKLFNFTKEELSNNLEDNMIMYLAVRDFN
ncbi:hypothetical protein C9374_007998 [Naegleria lovaniensis]|uniref:EKC/KEOPS complex subunit CGI121 n=1 Tax=Naegleria lovaniensis TaxID=51637 RepID=A0AA88KGS1_NAELO|nr:uncharacterized protein C9374_007998 [Naegleria lovaniensis]KAG2378850.1 hypothetical protein C9374_007998 [Naegleria lovaniensis]